jgi:hypothetical protein
MRAMGIPLLSVVMPPEQQHGFSLILFSRPQKAFPASFSRPVRRFQTLSEICVMFTFQGIIIVERYHGIGSTNFLGKLSVE